jgi:hypothetical protein
MVRVRVLHYGVDGMTASKATPFDTVPVESNVLTSNSSGLEEQYPT